MTISTRFNRFYHSAVLTEFFRKCGTIKFKLWVDDETGGVFEFVKGEHFNDVDDLKQILKNMNLDYAVAEDGDGKVSTSDINAKALCDHIEWVISLAADNNITFEFVEDEWRRLLAHAGIY